MNKETQIQKSIEEIIHHYGVSENSLLDFLSKDAKPEKTVVFIINEYEKYLQSMVKRGKRSPETWKTYNNVLVRAKEYILTHYPDLKLDELNEIIIGNFISNNNSERKYSIRTINRYHAIMKSILNFAYQTQNAKKDYRYKFTIEKTSLIPRYLKGEQIKQIVKTIETFPKPDRCRAMIMFLLFSGCRVSEVSKLKVKDFNIEDGLIYIYDGKGSQDRVIPIYPQLKQEILIYLQKSGMPEWDSKCDGYLFARDEGTERNRNFPIRTIQHLIERIRTRIPELSFMTVHSFRHTFAINCLKAGVKEHHLTQMLGHRDPKTTMTYTKLRGEDLKAEINKKFPFHFENLLNILGDD